MSSGGEGGGERERRVSRATVEHTAVQLRPETKHARTTNACKKERGREVEGKREGLGGGGQDGQDGVSLWELSTLQSNPYPKSFNHCQSPFKSLYMEELT